MFSVVSFKFLSKATPTRKNGASRGRVLAMETNGLTPESEIFTTADTEEE